jgi:hypothetical protein
MAHHSPERSNFKPAAALLAGLLIAMTPLLPGLVCIHHARK